MKPIDMYWPSAAFNISAIVFVSQVITDLLVLRKPGYEWVTMSTAVVFLICSLWCLLAELWNAYVFTKKVAKEDQ